MFETLIRLSGTWQFASVLVTLQIGLLVGSAWLINRVLKQKPQEKHFVWLAGFIAIALLVPCQALLPSWDWQVKQAAEAPPLLAEAPGVKSSRLSTPDSLDLQVSPDSSPQSSHLTSKSNAWNSLETAAASKAFPLDGREVKESTEADLGAAAKAALSVPNAQSKPRHFAGFIRISSLERLAWLYGVVVIFLLTRLGVACWRLRQIRSTDVLPYSSIQIATSVCKLAGLKRLPRFVLNQRVSTPMSYGILRPTVALPETFATWPEQTQRVVLAHEISHLQRRDAWWDFLANCICAVYWFHPAVFFAKSRLQQSRELATDQTAMAFGVRPADYARALLNVACESKFERSSNRLAIPMASEKHLQHRIEQALQFREEAASVSKLKRALSRASFVLVFGVIAAFSVQFTIANQPEELATLVQQEEAEPFPNELENSEVHGDAFYQRVAQSKLVTQEFQSGIPRVDISGRITNLDGTPAKNAIVLVRDGSSMSAGYGRKLNCAMAKTRTDDDGNYQFTQLQISGQYVKPQVMAFVESGEMAWKSIWARGVKAGGMVVDLKMEKAAPISGVVIDENQQPVTDATVSVRGFERMHPNSRGKQYVSLADRVITPQVKTDAEGRFEFPALPAQCVIRVSIAHENHPLYSGLLCSSDTVIQDSKTWDLRGAEVRKSGKTITMDSGIWLSGHVVTADSKPIPDAVVEFGYTNPENKTDENGQFKALLHSEWLAVEEARIVVRVRHKDYGTKRMRFSGPELVKAKDNFQIELETPAKISGRVVAEDLKTPIPDVSLTISSSSGMSRVVKSDVNGQYSTIVAAGEIQIRLFGEARGYHLRRDERDINSGERARMVQDFSVQPGQEKTLEPFVLERIPTMEFEVVDEKGEPVRDAVVSLLSTAQYESFETNSNAEQVAMDGVVTITPWLKPSGVSIAIAKLKRDGQQYWGEVVVDPEAKRNQITLLPTVIATGKVTKNGEPLSGVDLQIDLSLPNSLIAGLHPNRALSHPLATVTTNEEGVYTLAVPQRDPTGRESLLSVGVRRGIPNTEAGGIGRRMKRVGDNYSYDIKFYEGREEISGKVVDEDGKPVMNVAVFIARDFRGGGRDGWEPRYRLYQPTMVYSDAEGKFRIGGLPAERKLVLRTGTRDRHDYKIEYSSAEADVVAGESNLLFEVSRVEN